VNAVRPYGRRDIHPVVYEEQRVPLLAKRFYPRRLPGEFPVRHVFVPHLHGPATARKRGPRDVLVSALVSYGFRYDH
jgi:hypothetical protein